MKIDDIEHSNIVQFNFFPQHFFLSFSVNLSEQPANYSEDSKWYKYLFISFGFISWSLSFRIPYGKTLNPRDAYK